MKEEIKQLIDYLEDSSFSSYGAESVANEIAQKLRAILERKNI